MAENTTGSTAGNNRRIARNTLMLYIRMGMTMLVQLYTSRVVLEVLGIDDYGIWSLVATLVVSISFITIPLSSVVQRFINYEIGKGESGRVDVVFSQCFILYCIFCIILFLLFETIGFWLLNSKLQIPVEKMEIANIVFQISIMTFIITLLRMPYDAVIIAYEKMDFYAYISIIDVVLKLGIVYLLQVIVIESKLIFYSVLVLLVGAIMMFISKFYCNKNYSSTKVHLKINKPLLRSIATFSGWSLLGAFSLMTSNQGVGLILNSFCGIVISATMGIATQVGNAVNQFVGNFQMAFQPQIIKSYAENDIAYLRNLICRTSKFSFLMLLMIAYPLIYSMTDVLHIWLGDDVPPFTSQFCSLIIVSLLFDSLSAPLYMAIQATGHIMKYQIGISILLLGNIVLSYLCLKIEIAPVSTMIVKCVISVCCVVLRFWYMQRQIGFEITEYFKSVILPCLKVISFCALGALLLKLVDTNSGFLITVVKTIFLILYYFIVVVLLGLTKNERLKVLKRIKLRFKSA